MFIQRALLQQCSFLPYQGTVIPLFPYSHLGRFSQESGHFKHMSLLICWYSCCSHIPEVLERVEKLLRKKEPFPAVAPLLGIAFQISVQGGNCDLWQLGGDLKLPCVSHSHFQPSLTSMHHIS